jgi:hypothetical protein
MTSFEGSLQQKIKEVMMQVSLDAYTTNDLLFSCTWPIIQEEIMLKEGEVRGHGKITLVEMNEYGNL